MIEINLQKIKEVYVKASPRAKAHIRRIESSEKERWHQWQKFYKEKLYRSPGKNEPHEDAFAQIIMIAKSPEDAINRIKKFQEKYPSSVKGNLVQEFKNLYFKTRMDFDKPEKNPASGFIQLLRQKRAG